MGDNDILRDISQKRFFTKSIAARVEYGLQAYDENLALRRKRLTLMFDEEDNQLMKELKQFEKMKIQLILQMEKDSVQKLEEQKNKEKEEMLARKKMQLDMVKCKDIQHLIRRRRELQTQHIQEQQMKENQEKQKHARDVDNMWYYIMLSDSEKKREKDAQEQAERHKKNMERKRVLDHQVEESREAQRRRELEEREEANKLLSGYIVNASKQVSDEKQKKVVAKTTLNESLKTQICNKKELIQMEREQERELENSLARISIIREEEEDKKKIIEKAIQKRELEKYGQHAMTIKKEREARQRADELMVSEVSKKQFEESERQRCLMAKKSKQLLKEALTGRQQQLKEKQKEAQKVAMQAAKETEEIKIKQKMLVEQWKQEKEKDAKAKAAYKEYLEDQMKFTKMAKETEKRQLLSDFKNKLIQENDFNEKMVQLMKREFSSEGIHPFAKAVQQKKQPEKSFCPQVSESAYCKY